MSGKANPRSSGRESAHTSRRRKDQSRLTSAATRGFNEDPTAYGAEAPHSAFRTPRFIDLFFSIADLLDHHQPPAFVLENVKHLHRHDGGRTFKIIHDTLTDALGYRVYWKIINAQSVVPQHRQRIFLVGFKPGRAFEFPEFPTEGPKLASSGNPVRGDIVVEPAHKGFSSSVRSGILRRMANTYTQIYLHVVFAVEVGRISSNRNTTTSCRNTSPASCPLRGTS